MLLRTLRFYDPSTPVAGAAAPPVVIPPVVVEPPKVDPSVALTATIAELTAKLAARDTAERTKADADAAKRGEHEQLATKYKAELDANTATLTALQARETERIARVDAKNVERIAKIPAARATLVPKGLSGEALADYLDTNWLLITGETERAAGTQAGKPPGTAGSVTLTDSQKADAVRMNLSEADYIVVMTAAKRIKPAGAEA